MSPRKPAEAPLKFEDALRELERLTEYMESGQLPLDEAIEAYRKGTALLKSCQAQLADAEQRIRLLDQDSLTPFEPGATRGE